MNKAIRKLAAGCVATASAGALLLAATGTAAAATEKNGYLEASEFGLYYNSNSGGCVFDLFGSDWNFVNDYFTGPWGCAGAGGLIDDDTASYKNRDTYTWRVATDPNLGGLVGSLPPGYTGNASANFKNKISSATFRDD